MDIKSIPKIILPAYPQADQILQSFYQAAQDQPELTRLALAKDLILTWQENKLPTNLMPILASRQDYWYLFQVFALNRHVHDDKSRYHFCLSNQPTIYLDSQLTIFKSLFSHDFISRQQLDKIISDQSQDVIQRFGLSPKDWRLAPLPLDILLRLPAELTPLGDFNYHLDGYRLRPDGLLTGLVGGHLLFGGQSFVDSLFTSVSSQNLKTYLTIIPQTYGY